MILFQTVQDFAGRRAEFEYQIKVPLTIVIHKNNTTNYSKIINFIYKIIIKNKKFGIYYAE